MAVKKSLNKPLTPKQKDTGVKKTGYAKGPAKDGGKLYRIDNFTDGIMVGPKTKKFEPSDALRRCGQQSRT
jgi:hypothetical protein